MKWNFLLVSACVGCCFLKWMDLHFSFFMPPVLSRSLYLLLNLNKVKNVIYFRISNLWYLDISLLLLELLLYIKTYEYNCWLQLDFFLLIHLWRDRILDLNFILEHIQWFLSANRILVFVFMLNKSTII